MLPPSIWKKSRSLIHFAGAMAILFGVAAFTVHNSLPTNEVALPIEVIPPDGASEHIESITVHVNDPSGVDSLYLQGHALSYHFSLHAEGGTIEWGENDPDDIYDQKASFRINGGSWITLSNENVNCKYPEKLYGCVQGPLHTIRLEVPIAETGALASGQNTIDFRFNGTDNVGSAYRILDLELRRSDDRNAIDGTSFVETDYASWTAPTGSDASNGKALWHQEGILIEHPTGEPINASCSGCHADNGRDLKYFNFSNRSIVGRSRFHGLTEQQGQDIAAYIRSVDLQLPAGYDANDVGRPWTPVYQPGPGLDDKPVELWAAGVGLEGVLKNDLDALSYLQQQNTNSEGAVNVREMPIALQLPDWNNWLPDIHPFDIFGKNEFKSTELYQQVHDVIPDAAQNHRQKNIEDARNSVDKPFEVGFIGEFKKVDDNYNDASTDSPPASEVEEFLRRISRHQWRIVKEWHLHTEYKLQDLGEEIYRQSNPGEKAFFADRSWIGNNHNVFTTAPHMNSRPEYPDKGPYRNTCQNTFFSTAWYELQLIINVGQRGEVDNGGPMDWNYHQPHINGTEGCYNHSQLTRHHKALIVLYQERDGFKLAEAASNGNMGSKFKLRQGHPGEFFQSGRRRNQVPDHVERDLSTDVLRQFNEVVYRYGAEAWRRCTNDDECLEPSDHQPTNNGYRELQYANTFWWMMPKAKQIGVPATVLDSTARWAEEMWPLGDWEQWMLDENDTPSVSITAPSDGATFTAPASFAITLDASSSSSQIDRVSFSANNELIATSQTEPYEFTWEDVAAGTYTLVAKATDANGATSTSSSITITVEEDLSSGGSSDSPSTHTISLHTGWNLISSPVIPSDTDIEAIFSTIASDIVSVENEAGHTFQPADNVNTIGQWNAMESYMVFSKTDQSLTLTGEQTLPADSTTLTLEEGWNFVPYLPESSQPVADAFASVSDHLVLVKDFAGRAYIPEYGINEIGNVQSGQGYKVFVSSQCSLTYPAPSKSKTTTVSVNLSQ